MRGEMRTGGALSNSAEDAPLETGLSRDEAQARLTAQGPNELPKQEEKSALRELLGQFANPIVLTLLAALVVAAIDGSNRTSTSWLVRYGDALSILLIVLLNAVLGFVQERRAEAALSALERMQTKTARVRRSGERIEIPAREVVEGDILLLEAGDVVSADARLVESKELSAEESALTGESLPVEKSEKPPVLDKEHSDTVFQGTAVVKGRGTAVVFGTGPRTALGRINQLVGATVKDVPPIQADLDRFGKQILVGCLALSAVLFIRGITAGGRSWSELFLEAVSLAVAAIPEGLPAITTITLALGMQRMAERGAIIRRLAAVETLGGATVICADKTGTLTQNAMTVRELFVAGTALTVSGTGYSPKGEVSGPGAGPTHDVVETLQDAARLCNDAEIKEVTPWHFVPVGDPTEAALITLSRKRPEPHMAKAMTARRVHELPFDSERRRMSVIVELGGELVVFAKGGADALLALCTHVEMGDRKVALDAGMQQELLKASDGMSERALRVLALAKRKFTMPSDGRSVSDLRPDEIEEGLTFLGFVGMKDPPREGVREAIQACRDAQVSVIMITGDHKKTAIAIAKELSLWDDEAIAISGEELKQMSEAEFKEKRAHVRVFARVSPEQKLDIVHAFKADGQIVAMTGDGVNDAPALREAHIGIAMGKGGTDVARAAADMVLADDNFGTIVEAIREGRAIYRNIQKFIFFLLSSNAGLCLIVFIASFSRALLPLTPLMLLWINLVTNGLPALGLGIDPPERSQMSEPPRKQHQSVLSVRDYFGMLAVGIGMAAAGMVTYMYPLIDATVSRERARALTFSLLAISPLFHAFSCRSPRASVFSLRPFVAMPVLISVVLSLAIHLVSVMIPSLRIVFQTFPVSPIEWLMVTGLSAAIIPFVELMKLADRRLRPAS